MFQCARYSDYPLMNVYDHQLEFLVGQRDGALSFLDRKSININYKCQGKYKTDKM